MPVSMQDHLTAIKEACDCEGLSICVQGWKQIVSTPRWKRRRGGGFSFFHSHPGPSTEVESSEAKDVADQVRAWQCKELRRAIHVVRACASAEGL